MAGLVSAPLFRVSDHAADVPPQDLHREATLQRLPRALREAFRKTRTKWIHRSPSTREEHSG